MMQTFGNRQIDFARKYPPLKLVVMPTSALLTEFWHKIVATTDAKGRSKMAACVFALVLGIGVVDFFLPFDISLLVFYFIPVGLAVAALGWQAGIATALVSVGTWMAGDLAAGRRYPSFLVASWNALIALGTYLLVVWLLWALLRTQRQIESRVRSELLREIGQRERLEKEVLEISERERRRVGHDLHDGLGQHLTATAIAARVLQGRLTALGIAEADQARKIVELVGHAIDQTRDLAKGLLLADIEEERLPAVLQEMATATSDQFHVRCVCQTLEAVPLRDEATASHLYRIAQEAVRNAVRHGAATRIWISLAKVNGAVTLAIVDNGAGLPPPSTRGRGMGLRIMAHRSQMIGAVFLAESRAEGGTRILCSLANEEKQSSGNPFP